MMDVTALVLTIGEDTTERAIEALRRQTVPVKEIVVVKDISPFYRAMNEGVSRISTPFFLQCDADMIPDPDCIETMIKHVSEEIGITIGYLEDALLGKIQAIKMFRTECVREIQFADHVSPDTNYLGKMSARGWKHVFVSRGKDAGNGHAHDVMGMHDPDYNPLYTYSKFKLEGARMRERAVFNEFVGSIKVLGASEHPMAPIALAGICRGITSDLSGDGLAKYTPTMDFKLLESYFSSQKPIDDFMVLHEAMKEHAELSELVP